MVAFGNPLDGLIHAKGWSRPAGNNEPVVTATFADHIAGDRNPGVDIGTGRCGDVLIAQCDGTVTLSGLVGYPTPNALTVRYVSSRHPDFEPAATHMATILPAIVKGAAVKKGQPIGTLGKTGAAACHLHMGLKRLIAGKWVEIDGWPYLEQNGATEDDVLQGANPRPIDNKKVFTSTGSDDLRFRLSPFVRTDNILAMLPNGTELHPDFIVDGTKVGAAADPRWYSTWAKTPKGIEFGYVSVVYCTAQQPIEQSGHTDAELIETARRAGHNAAVDVSAVGKTALDAAAAKYP